MPNHDPLHPSVWDLMPHWARGECNGELVLGAQLPTRDGRRTGNGHIVEIGPSQWDPDLTIYTVLTDAGTVLKLLASEVAELYYQPRWVSDVSQVLQKFKDRDVIDPEPGEPGQPGTQS